jgi:hypothetical protein
LALSNSWSYVPQDGSYMGVVDSGNGGCKSGLSQAFTAAAGDTIDGWAFFATTEDGEYKYNDAGGVLLIGPGGTETVLFSADVNMVGGYGGSAWTPFSATLTSSGSYTLHVIAQNVGDCYFSSWVGIDGVQISGSQTFGFEGFAAPVDNDQINIAKAGQTVPVTWRLTDSDGIAVSDPASFESLTSQASGACATMPTDAIESYSGGSGLQYLGDGTWQYNWKTFKDYAGQCRTMTVALSDGTTHQATFQFK